MTAPVLTLHCPSMLYVDAETGLVYGARGEPRGVLNSSGYLVTTYKDQHTGRVTTKSNHRIVWEAISGHHGALPECLHVHHINGIRLDNRASNLEAIPAKDNIREAAARATALRQARKHLDEDTIAFIATSYGVLTDAEAAEQLDIPEAWIQAVRVHHANRELLNWHAERKRAKQHDRQRAKATNPQGKRRSDKAQD